MLDKTPNGTVAHTRPPAKMNLFLELLGRREDGFHEIDTVMVPIDWCDDFRLKRTQAPGIRLNVGWLPSTQIVANRLGIQSQSSDLHPLLAIPDDERNLVHKALRRLSESFELQGGFECDLRKSIPAGAGLGGASSDAASALRCAAVLCGIPLQSPQLLEIAASIGSDVPFFLGIANESTGDNPITAARATGRGERINAIQMTTTLHCVVIFPGVSLSTSKVYAESRVPLDPQFACRMVEALERGETDELKRELMNRLTQPAKKLAPQIDETLESLWRMGLRTCQLTGSGSACFAIASSPSEARRVAAKARAMLEPGAIVMAVRSVSVPAAVELT